MTRAGLVLTLTAFIFLPQACGAREAAAPEAPPAVEVKAAVAPFTAVPVAAPIDGTVVTVHATEEGVVQQGDPIVTLENASVVRDLAHARAAVLAAERRLRGGSAAAPAADSSFAARERAAESIVQQKEDRLERLRGLLASGDVSRQEVENAQAELTAAKRDLDAEYDRARAATTAPVADRSLLEAELERARADLAFAQHRNEQLVVRAPAAGTLAELRVTPGARVYFRDPLAEIVDRSSARVEAQVAPELLRFVTRGRSVDVRLMTIPPRRYRGPVADVVPPGGTGGPAIIVNVPNPDRMLQPGTPAVITIQ